MNFVILISKKCIKMTNLFLVILFLVHAIFFFDVLAQERSSSKGTLCVPTWCCGWHKHDSMVNFQPWGNELLKPIESPDKMEMKENGTLLCMSPWSTWACYVYKMWGGSTNVFKYVSVLDALPLDYCGVLSRLPQVTCIDHSSVWFVMHFIVPQPHDHLSSPHNILTAWKSPQTNFLGCCLPGKYSLCHLFTSVTCPCRRKMLLFTCMQSLQVLTPCWDVLTKDRLLPHSLPSQHNWTLAQPKSLLLAYTPVPKTLPEFCSKQSEQAHGFQVVPIVERSSNLWPHSVTILLPWLPSHPYRLIAWMVFPGSHTPPSWVCL